MYALFTALCAVCYPPLHEQVFFFREMLFTGSLNSNPSFFHQAGAVGYRSIAAFPPSPQVRWICQPRHVWDMDPQPQSTPLPQAGFAVSALASWVWALLSQGAINPVLSCLDRPWKWCFWVEILQLGVRSFHSQSQWKFPLEMLLLLFQVGWDQFLLIRSVMHVKQIRTKMRAAWR